MKLLISCICVFLVIFPAAYAVGIGEEGQTGSSEPPTSPEALQNTISNGGSGDFSFSNPTEVNLPNGEKATVSGNVKVENGKIVSADSIKIENSQMSNARNVQPLPNGGYSAESAVQIQSDTYLLTNAQGVRFENGILTAAKADSFLRFGAISTNINNLESDISSFSVQQADSVVSGCVNVQGIEDSSFKIYSNAVEIESNGNAMEIEDCSFNRMAFSGRKIAISKETPARYRIGNGTLNYTGERYNESLDAGNSTIAEMGAEGFSCLTIKAPGTYWYSENLIRDFGINIPSSEYRLCLRKIPGEPFGNYDGLVDFPAKRILLNKIANYLRLPFKDGNLLSLTMDMAYEGKDGNNTFKADFDGNFDFIEDIFLNNEKAGNNENNGQNTISNEISINNQNNNGENAISNENNNQNSINNGNNDQNNNNENQNNEKNISILRSGYHEIIDEKGTRFAKIHREKFFPDKLKAYETDFFNSIITINSGVLTQKGDTEVKILSIQPKGERG